MTIIFKEDDDYDEYDGSTKPKIIPKNRSGPGSYNMNHKNFEIRSLSKSSTTGYGILIGIAFELF